MSTIRKTITLSGQQDQWVQGRIASGDYSNDNEYIRDLIRRDQEQGIKTRAQLLALQAAIQDGLQSGDSKQSVPQIMKSVERRLKANGKL